MKGGFKESPLQLNEGLGLLETLERRHDQDACRSACAMLRTRGLGWRRALPSTCLTALPAYRREQPAATPSMTTRTSSRAARCDRCSRRFRKEVLALDPCVTEEFLKLYVAYKAETNFVDVVPQAKRLRLSLNMQFHELHDPRGMAKDVTNLGRWGNGDVEVGLDSARGAALRHGPGAPGLREADGQRGDRR